MMSPLEIIFRYYFKVECMCDEKLVIPFQKEYCIVSKYSLRSLLVYPYSFLRRPLLVYPFLLFLFLKWDSQHYFS